jgi:monofunctional biosynthetic peptidoglycan transglycosylase
MDGMRAAGTSNSKTLMRETMAVPHPGLRRHAAATAAGLCPRSKAARKLQGGRAMKTSPKKAPRRKATLLRRVVSLIYILPLLFLGLFLGLAILYSQTHPPSMLMLGRWITRQPVERIWVPLDDISRNLVAAVVTSEDARFCSHHGVDWIEMRNAIEDEDGEGGPSRGASTITMQTVKNLFLWNSRSFIRKGLEIPMALGLDQLWSKRRILEVYLNIAEWGEGVFGAEAAARRDFGKSARELTPREAALLAAALPNPKLRDARHPSRGHQRRAATIARTASPDADWLDCVVKD